MTTVFYAFLALGGLSIFCMATAAFIRWPILALYCVGAFTLVAWDFPAIPTLANLGIVQVKPEDAVVLTALTATVLRPSMFKEITRRYNGLLILILISLLFTLSWGLYRYGSTAFNEFRGFLWPIGITAWALNQDWKDEAWQRSFVKWARLTGMGLILVFAVHAALYGLGNSDSFVMNVFGIEQTGRPLVSSQALMLGLVAILEFANSRNKERIGSVRMGLLFLAIAVLCQHRSVWAAIGIAFVVIALRLRGVALARVVMGGFFASVACFVIWASGAVDNLIQTLTTSASSGGTYAARLDTWTELVDDSIIRGYGSIILGEPFGFGYNRYSDDGRLLTFAPHNWYVSVYLRLGLVGLILFVVLLLRVFASLVRAKDLASTMIFIALVVYMWSYSLSWYLAPMLAFTFAVAFAFTPEKRVKQKRTTQVDLGPHYARLAARNAARQAHAAPPANLPISTGPSGS